MSFTSDLNGFTSRTADRQRLVAQKVAMELFKRVIYRTPVDTGRARGNWQTTIGTPAIGEIERVSGADSEAVQVASTWDPARETIFLSNNVPYIEALENGHSPQTPPGGMVRLSVNEFENIVREML